MVENSRHKLEQKKLDLICANNLKVEGAGFGEGTNVVTLITKDSEEQLEKASKDTVASQIIDRIIEKL